MSSRSEGTNPRALGTNPRGPREPTREERLDADLAAQRRAARAIEEANDEREQEISDTPQAPMPEELRQWRRGELPAKALLEDPPSDAWDDRSDLA